MITVLPRATSISCTACVNTCSPTWASRADRGSSKMTMSGSEYRARAMLTRCFCPPLRLMPFSPISVLSLSGRIFKSCSSPLAATTWAYFFSSKAAPNRMLLRSVALNMAACWATYATRP
mmetsp:Transcript_6904/g.13116  ORF Transcript_6904/g.13116 Transcript_6904/m.13116 type:complete len:120 (-) Transcript_6904:610-969(-)